MGCHMRCDWELQELTLDQVPYIMEVISRFNIDQEAETPAVHTHRLTGEDSKGPTGEDCCYYATVGALLCTSNAMRIVARYCTDPGRAYREAVQRTMQYLLICNQSNGWGITYGGDGASCNILAHANSDYAGDTDTRCLVLGGVVMLGRGAVSWFSRMQKPVAQSTTEVAYLALGEMGKTILFLVQVLVSIVPEWPIREHVSWRKILSAHTG
ncbi:unnamed protein product [Discosporangium mesarthrocarpum]